MDTINEKIVVEKVLEEMEKAENYVKIWSSAWQETCSYAYSMSLYHTGMADVQKLEAKYYYQYLLPNVYYPENKTGEPLRKVELVDRYENRHECEFRTICWDGMNSNKCRRSFVFKNNGNISFSKNVRKRKTIKHPKQISYEATYNVLLRDFYVEIGIDELIEKSTYRPYIYKYDNLVLSLSGNILTRRLNNIEIVEDLRTGIKQIKIVKKYDKFSNNTSISFECSLNPNDNLEMGVVAINTHKRNGKINGTYRFDISRKKGIRANFYSRKGIKVDLTTNPMLLGFTNLLLLPLSTTKSNDDIIISNFVNSFQNLIVKNLDEGATSFDNSDFDMEFIKKIEDRIIEMVEFIKCELPLSGLVERIDNCITLLDKKTNEEQRENLKTFRLKANN